MAHHQAMLFLGIANGIHNDIVSHWFHSDPRVPPPSFYFKSEFLTTSHPPNFRMKNRTFYRPTGRPPLLSWCIATPHTTHPRTHVLSSGTYTVMISNAGGGGQSWTNDLSVTRWRADSLTDEYGTFFDSRCCEAARTMSATYLPLCKDADDYESVSRSIKRSFAVATRRGRRGSKSRCRLRIMRKSDA